jgi:hypothetical protein
MNTQVTEMDPVNEIDFLEIKNKALESGFF